MRIYHVNSYRVYTGQSAQLATGAGRPKGWVRSDVEPPAQEGKVAYWTGSGWTLIDPPAINESSSSPVDAPVVLTVLQLRRLFTFEEKVALEQAITEGNAAIKVFMDDLAAAEFVDLSDPLVVDGLHFLVQQGFLTPERAEQILANEVPSATSIDSD